MLNVCCVALLCTELESQLATHVELTLHIVFSVRCSLCRQAMNRVLVAVSNMDSTGFSHEISCILHVMLTPLEQT